MDDTRHCNSCGTAVQRDSNYAADARKSLYRICNDVPRLLCHSDARVEYAAEPCDAPLRIACSDPRLQNAILEHRSRGSGACGRSCHRRVHDNARRQNAQLATLYRYDSRLDRCRRYMGGDPRRLQGAVEHKRNALYSYDELRGDTARFLLRNGVGGPEGLGQGRYNQPVNSRRLVPHHR